MNTQTFEQSNFGPSVKEGGSIDVDLRATEWIIRIDFADFALLKGDDAARRAFSPGMNLMHELGHAILRLPDPEGPGDKLGECERFLNLMRAELSLPLRQYYFPKTRSGGIEFFDFTF